LDGFLAHLPGLSVTALTGSLLYCAYELWKTGIASNQVYRRHSAVVVGIAGESAAGKDTLCRFLEQLLGPDKMLQMDGDDYHRWARNDPRYRRFSHLHPASNRLHQQTEDLDRLTRGQAIDAPRYDHASGKHTKPVRRDPKEFIVVSGLHTFLLPGTQQLLDLRIYLDPEPALRQHWKLLRDTSQRGHSPVDVQQQVASRTEDADRFVRPQQSWADLTIQLILRPGSSMDDYLHSGQEALALRLTSSPDFDWNSPIALLTQASAQMDIDVEISDAGGPVTLTVLGEIPAAAVASVARQLIPNLHEIIAERPKWEAGLNGVIQLFVLHYLAQVRQLPDTPPGTRRA